MELVQICPKALGAGKGEQIYGADHLKVVRCSQATILIHIQCAGKQGVEARAENKPDRLQLADASPL
jgi:hypothetical protein